MKYKNTIFYQGKKEVKFNFSAEEITSDGAIVLIKKIEKKNKIIKSFSSVLQDKRNKSYTEHSLEKLISRRVFLLIQGYSDCNDVNYLSNDPALKVSLDGDLASQSTLSRLENSISIKDIVRLSEHLIQSYIDTIDVSRKQITIDVDGTDDPTYGDQQLTMFNGYYKQYMYHQLLFHDGDTGQLILPILRPGNCHSNKWFVSILKRIVERIKQRRPDLTIVVRGDCGFSCPEFYKLAELENLKFCIGITTNDRLKKHTSLLDARIREEYLSKKEKIQMFVEAFSYQADSWDKPQTCYAKVESTGRGMNIRYICSNMKTTSAKDLYKEFYVMRGDASENRIKEFKNMCFADRLSCHRFTANFFRLFLSALTYEFYFKIKCLIKQSSYDEAKKWQIDNIRLYLMKVGATVDSKVKSIIIKFSKSYICRNLFAEIVQLCY
jgi:hypothetical protein